MLCGAAEMDQCLRALAALIESIGWIPSLNCGSQVCITPVPGGRTPSSDLQEYQPCMWLIHIYVDKTLIHIKRQTWKKEGTRASQQFVPEEMQHCLSGSGSHHLCTVSSSLFTYRSWLHFSERWIEFHCVYVLHLHYPFLSWGTSGLFPFHSYCEYRSQCPAQVIYNSVSQSKAQRITEEWVGRRGETGKGEENSKILSPACAWQTHKSCDHSYNWLHRNR